VCSSLLVVPCQPRIDAALECCGQLKGLRRHIGRAAVVPQAKWGTNSAHRPVDVSVLRGGQPPSNPPVGRERRVPQRDGRRGQNTVEAFDVGVGSVGNLPGP